MFYPSHTSFVWSASKNFHSTKVVTRSKAFTVFHMSDHLLVGSNHIWGTHWRFSAFMSLYVYRRCDGVAAGQSVFQVPTKRFINLENGKICTASACSRRMLQDFRFCTSYVWNSESSGMRSRDAGSADIKTSTPSNTVPHPNRIES